MRPHQFFQDRYTPEKFLGSHLEGEIVVVVSGRNHRLLSVKWSRIPRLVTVVRPNKKQKRASSARFCSMANDLRSAGSQLVIGFEFQFLGFLSW